MLSGTISTICITLLEMLYYFLIYEKTKWEEQN